MVAMMSRQAQDTLDRIYAAALKPSRWPDALSAICGLTGFASGCVILGGMDRLQPEFHATSRTERALGDFIAAGHFKSCVNRMIRLGRGRFAHESEFPEAAAKRPAVETLRSLGLWDQTATRQPLPQDRHVVFTFERERDAPGFSPQAVDILNKLRPHLVRSASMGLPGDAGRIQFLDHLSVPALVIGPDSSIFEMNELAAVFQPRLVDARTQRLTLPGWQNAAGVELRLEQAALARTALTVPVCPKDTAYPRQTLQAVPTLWSGHEALLVTLVPASSRAALESLAQRYGLTLREAELAALLCKGDSLRGAAGQLGISHETVRHHLKQVFLKTDTHRQAELVARLADDR